MTMEKEFLTTREAADYLTLKENTLEIWRLRGTGPAFVKFGRAVRYPMEDLLSYKNECRRASTSICEIKA